MAIVIVQVGQCGNQVGDELFTQLSTILGIGSSPPPGSPRVTHANPMAGMNRPLGNPTPFFTQNGYARCVLIDSEPKVVHGVQKRHPHFIRPDNVVCGQSGRGNNWGLGYYGVNDPQSKRSEGKSVGESRAFRNMYKGQRVKDDGLFSSALKAIHAETRRTTDMDDFEAIILIHSLSGGTGSGLASRLAERIRLYFVEAMEGEPDVDELYEDKMRMLDNLDTMLMEKRRARYFISIPIAPLVLGELATQGINAALTLDVLLKQVDAIVLLRNDDALSPGDSSGASSSTSSGAGEAALLLKCTTFKEVNEVLVAMLLPVLQFGLGTGAVEAMVRQCAPRMAMDTGGNRILTLLPTPQRVYERFRACAHRARFYGFYGGKDFMPGCKPEFPESIVLTPAALQRGTREEVSEERRGRGRGAGKRKPLWKSVSRRTPQAEAFQFSREEEVDRSMDDDPPESASYFAVHAHVPPALREYLSTMRRSPSASFFANVEGVAVLNQAQELNRSLLFPLLFSALVKVKVGAYTSAYQEVGVTAARIEKAVRSVAEAMLNAEGVR